MDYPTAGHASSDRRVLLVEDDEDFRSALADILLSRKYQVYTAAHAAEAQQQLHSHAPEVAVVDIKLGGDNGVELTHLLRQEDPRLHCVLLTAYGSLETAIRGLRYGISDYLRKPIEPMELLAVLDRVYAKVEAERLLLAKTTELELAHSQLLAYKEKLRAAARQRQLTEARERREIAADLHDSLGQNLATASFKLGQLLQRMDAENPLQPLAMESRVLVKAAIAQVRQVVFSIVPPLLYEMGLGLAVERLAETMEQQFGYACNVEHEGDWSLLSPELALLCFRSIRELLINAGKHAEASSVTCTLNLTSGMLTATVCDNGKGFTPPSADGPQPSGYGLFSIRDRMEYLGGKFGLESRQGEGTTLSLTLPIQP